ncbi:BlaI/MecI/CopY family transcriptional regulator [Mucilaginibacter myungsuensis]|uniref:BlaI/MecI/CopY family transcriptional regulator n=1 Tax=Mucilaginibacter myungsuensis TaxID=649104 RepID=A0A929KWC8_9SPHI|nr:BlaI/MecI/CopY family transcriptional regulator [Mucilaginibacter myungsuensis]MBE9662829.1 BlaI/MecI/CopY family transcriptional regulator [Mucilaginibacter myungsuensis]MDN3598249.1 BlaI/MecI/CopY family transcriptional regulator [Mucilaginibacter myungsuensis]
MQLTKAEEQLMEIIWKHEKVFMKDLIDAYPDPKPAGTTIATLLKRMQDKGFVGYETMGNSRQYYPLVKKSAYFTKEVGGIIKNYFNDSALQFASFFTSSSNISPTELEDLKAIIDKEIERRKEK